MLPALKPGDMSKDVEKGMTDSLDRRSAEILQFPAGGRAGIGGRRDEVKPAEPFVAPRPVKIVSGAWYHEEAVQDARRDNVR
jgi:Protein of unknown function (DUF2735)